MNHTKLYILVEGVTDSAFIADLLKSKEFGFIDNPAKPSSKSEKYLHKLSDEIVTLAEIIIRKLGGWTQVKNSSIQTDIEEKTKQGYACLLIFDADDSDADESGFETRLSVIEAALPEPLKSHCHIFLLPDNTNDGDLEDLLRQIVLEDIGFHCIEQFADCIAQYNPIKKKDLIYQLMKTHIPKQNSPPWNFTHNILQPLNDFFNQCLVQPRE